MRRILSTAVAVLLAFLMGCGKDNPVKPTQPGPKYLPSSTPQNALENMRRAYITRDTLGYDSTFDAAYIGTSIDQTDPSPTLATFTKVDESQHIRALARASSISSMNLQFVSQFRFSDAGDTLGWATVQAAGPQLQIFDGPNVWFVTPNNELMEFKFRPTSPSPGSPTDTTWHIVRWTEVRN